MQSDSLVENVTRSTMETFQYFDLLHGEGYYIRPTKVMGKQVNWMEVWGIVSLLARYTIY